MPPIAPGWPGEGVFKVIAPGAFPFSTHSTSSGCGARSAQGTAAGSSPDGATAGWSDLGKWHILQRLLDASDDQGNVVRSADVVAVDARDNFVMASEGRTPHKAVAMMGVSDIVVVDTDDALLVAHKDVVGDVKDALEQLKERGRTDVL